MRLVSGSIVACVVVFATASLAHGTTDGAATSLRPVDGSLRGLVSTRAIGSLRFGASPAEVRVWAGEPEYTRVPRRARSGAIIWGYHCKGIDPATGNDGNAGCHTEFGFRDGKLTSFGTASRLFSVRNGVRPGMIVEEAERRLPDAGTGAGVLTASTAHRSGTEVVVHFARWPNRPRVYNLYASNGRHAFTAPC